MCCEPCQIATAGCALQTPKPGPSSFLPLPRPPARPPARSGGSTAAPISALRARAPPARGAPNVSRRRPPLSPRAARGAPNSHTTACTPREPEPPPPCRPLRRARAPVPQRSCNSARAIGTHILEDGLVDLLALLLQVVHALDELVVVVLQRRALRRHRARRAVNNDRAQPELLDMRRERRGQLSGAECAGGAPVGRGGQGMYAGRRTAQKPVR